MDILSYHGLEYIVQWAVQAVPGNVHVPAAYKHRSLLYLAEGGTFS